MPGRLPTSSDFPSSLQVSVTSPPSSSPRHTNVLILLHGLGDLALPFKQLGTKLSLPETTCVTVRAPNPLPFNIGGFHWGDDAVLDKSTGAMELDAGFTKAVKIIKQDVIEDGLLKKCGYSPEEIILLGLGQGAMAALAAASAFSGELGGIISLGGPLPKSVTSTAVATPVLIVGGSSDSAISPSALTRIQSVFRNHEYHKWKRAGDGMPQSRDEMLPVMRFFGRRLKSRQGVPSGSIQVQ